MCSAFIKVFRSRIKSYLLALVLINISIASHAATLTGVIKDSNDAPIVGASALLFEVINGDLIQSGEIIQVADNGQYSWTIDDGDYVLRAFFNASDVSIVGAPNIVTIQTEDFPVAGDVIRDSVFDFVTLSGRVIDNNKLPVPNVDLQASLTWNGPAVGAQGIISQQNVTHINQSSLTDSDGQYSLLVFSSDTCIASGFYPEDVDCYYDITFAPPIDTGFSNVDEFDYSITGDQTLNAELTFSDQIAPKIIIGPYVKNISDTNAVIEWVTDEVTSASVEITAGDTFTESTLLTFHSIVVTGLSANTDYSALIHSTDAQGNLSDTSSINFTSAATPDLTAPKYIQAPSVSAIGDTHFTISFCADEPVSGKIIVDNTDYLINELSSCHQTTINDLNPNQSYSVFASISDGAANGPTLSEIEAVTTLAAADFNSPEIIAGPAIIDVSDSTAVVAWTTNEPATSGLTFNDGNIYRVINNDNLVTQHSAQITSLSPDTLYSLRVSSKDAAGNGPTLSTAVEFVTLSTPDINAPLFIGRPLVLDITDNSAMISWQTDESSSTLASIGLQSNNLNRIETTSDFLPQHNLAITNLDPATTYFFTVQSSDLAGNNSTSNVFSFTTKVEAQTTQLKIVTGPIIERLTGNSVTLSWRTNANADSRLVCESANGISEVNKIALQKNHVITLTGLQFDTSYRCVIYSTDIQGTIVNKVLGILSTEETDITAPQCVATPTVNAFATFAELTWETDELSSALIQYRKIGATNWSQKASTELNQSGFILLTELEENTNYEHQITLTDAVGNNASCPIAEFNSGTIIDVPAPIFSIQPFVTDIENFSASVHWDTEQISNGLVRFGLLDTQMINIESTTEFSLSHQLILNNLQAATTYFIQVDAFNVEGDMTSSEIISFITTPIAEIELTPPVIISGPYVRNITDISAVVEWQTDKASNSFVVIDGGNTFSVDTLTTLHSVPLTSLSANTDYSTQVTSTDQYGNTSTPLPANFRTLGLADTTLPKYVSGPNILAIDYNQFTVSFCADEPVTGIITIDSTDYPLETASVCHQLVIAGLTANTQYQVVCSITDIAGNGPVLSSPITATTLLELDITAPQITGPIVTNITDSTAIVSWTTNESATSGVSYTDGITTNDLNDSELVTNHTTYLSGLTADTTYTLTVSSSDGLGNGPTISQPVSFTTLGLPDTSAPLIISGPFVEDITTNSAYILWTTDEAASHLVLIGLSENNLDRSIAIAGYDNQHIVSVTELSPDTLYYFQVSSSDLAGNTVTSDVLSFRTLSPVEIPVALQITAGPDVESTTIESLTISWETNFISDSRLVCEAEQSVMAQSGLSALATVNSVDSSLAIKDQYIVILKDQANTSVLSKTSVPIALSLLSVSQRKIEIDNMAQDIAVNVNGQITRQFFNAVNGFVLNMQASEIDTLRQDPRVLMIEQDQMMSASITQAGATWGLDRIDQTDLPLDTNYTYNLDGSGVNAYIIDTGVLVTHGDFGGRAVHGWDFVDNDADATDCNGHGTHVAGTVGSSTWGVAKNVSITAIRVLGCNGSGTNSGVIGGIDWVTDNAVLPAVANMSLGGGNSPALDAAVNNAINSGITFAVAAGNSNINACSGSPNKVPAAITVASSTSNDSRSSFSNWGSCVDLFAPGSDITSTWSNGGTNTISGTSMASPHVAGAIALYLQAHPNSTPAEVDSGISGFATTNKISSLNGSPNLLINVTFDGNTEIQPPPPPPPAEKITFEIADDQLSKSHMLTLTGLPASTIFQCTVSSTDISNSQVSADIRVTTNDMPDVTPPVCTTTPNVTGFTDTAQVSWTSDELTTAIIDYRTIGASDWSQNGTLSFATSDSLLLTGLIAETQYEQQITLTDQSGNTTQCPAGNFNTIAPEAIAEAIFKIQPVITNIEEHSVTVSWETLEASSANVRYGKSATALIESQADNQFVSAHSISLQNLESNTLYYLQVDAFNILGEITNSEIVNFKTAHPDNDFDNDGVLNDVDNCPVTPNPDQIDSDNDGLGDECDLPDPPDNDFDNDGILDDIDNCPIDANPDQLDSDGDGAGDVCDSPIDPSPTSDFDQDTILDDVDNCPTIPNTDQLDSDNNGVGDACDIPDDITPPPPQLTGINLRGTITGEGSPIEGAVVALYNNQQQFLRSETTPTDGSYLFKFVEAGEYFIGVTPPMDTNFAATPLQAITVADRDVVHLISLIGDAITLSGYLKDSQARLIDNVLVSLHIQTTGNQVGNSVRTDATGYFEFAVAPGTYKLRPVIDVFNVPQGSTPIIPAYSVPDFATIFHAPQNIQVSADTQLDVILPFALLSGQTLDTLGNPVAGVALSIRHQYATNQQTYYLENYGTDESSNAISDASGNFEFAVFTEQAFDILLTPPSSRLDLAVTKISDYSLSTDSSETFTLVEGVTLSGALQDTQGRTIDNTKITLHDQQTGDQIGQSVFTDAVGLFQFQVEAGDYKIKPHLNPFGQGEGQRPSYPLPDFATVLYPEENVSVVGNTVQDIILPLAILSGTTTSANGLTIADTKVRISHIAHQINGNIETSYYLESHGSSLVTHAKTDANGQFSVALFTDQAIDISFMPPVTNRAVATTQVLDYLIDQDTTDTFILEQSLTLSGYLKDEQGNVIDNTLITAHNDVNNQLADRPAITDENGYFEFKVATGNYKLRPYLQLTNSVNGINLTSTYPVPDFASVYYLPKNISVSADLQLDVVMPMSILVGKTLDANGVAVAGIKLRADHAFSQNSVSYYLENDADLNDSNALSKQNGDFGFALFTNQETDISVNPPALSGFAITSISHNLVQETSEDIFLLHQDTRPKIITGPTVTRISDRSAILVWETDKPATGIIELSNGTRIETTRLTTYNCIVLWNLDSGTQYTVTVQAVDKDSQTSDTKSTSFTTLSVPYTKAPEFVDGPIVLNITETEFEVSFCADGPVTGAVIIDGEIFTFDDLDVCHKILIENRQANTPYTVVVTIMDPLGNGPTVSQPQTITTLPTPDLTAPEILLLPFVIDISDTEATVLWRTDEPASSGVSYNDGVLYHVVTNNDFVQEHSLQLTDLTPETTYSLIVSSTDAAGNGPTLSLPITFTTQAAPDITPPTMIGNPLIQNITHQSVVIRWKSDEPSTTVLVIGTSATQLDQTETRSGLRTKHNLAITGLDADTIYFFQVQSKDASGNLLTSEIFSFRTKVRGHQGEPHFMNDVKIKKITNTSITVGWKTDVNADGRLVCIGNNITLETSHAKRSKKHLLTLTRLQQNTSYECTIYSTDHHGYTASQAINGATSKSGLEHKIVDTSSDNFWLLLADSMKLLAGIVTSDFEDVTAPTTLSAPITRGFGNFATVEIDSNEIAAANIQYRQSGDTTWLHTGELISQLSHLVTIGDLNTNTDYEMQFSLVDIVGNVFQSTPVTFNTGSVLDLPSPEFSIAPSITNITTSSAIIDWTTSDYSHVQVSFGTRSDSLLDKEANADLGKNQTVSLIRLEPATIYYVQLVAYNIAGESIATEIFSFITPALNNTIDTDNDGLPDTWEIDNGLNPQDITDGGGDIDNDGLTNLEEYLAQTDPNNEDSDSDGIPDGWEVDHQLDPNDASDADLDPDGNGISNLDEYLNASDKDSPVITFTEEISIDAAGILTAVPTNNVSAFDAVDGSVAVTIQGSEYLLSGKHIINWVAQDAAGNVSVASQIINIRPQVLVTQSQITAEGNSISVDVFLSGEAPVYPVTINFAINGSADIDDYLIDDIASEITNSISIEQGLKGALTLQIIEDGLTESDETLIVTFSQPSNAVMGLNSQHSIIITESNVAPKVTIRAEQNGNPVTTVTRVDGPVTLSLVVEDANRDDQHSIDWSNSDNLLIDTDSIESSLTFEPVDLAVGIYQATALVNDNGIPIASVSTTFNLKVIETAPILSATIDTDGDGINDADEGFQDTDFDGIPDHLDAMNSTHLLQQQVLNSNNGVPIKSDGIFWLQTEPGLVISLGATALNDPTGGALVNDQTFSSSEIFAAHGSDDSFFHFGGLFDFEISNLANIGDSVEVVIPLNEVIPESAIYRKLHPVNGWQDFVENNNNQLYSAVGVEGVCPSPGDIAYTNGLTAGHWCLMLLIEDGGENDGDDIANGVIIDPGSIAVEIPALLDISIPAIANVTEGSNIALTATITENGNAITTYQWQRVSGPAINISNANQLNASISNAPVGTLVLRLTITDELNRSVSDTVSITVTAKVESESGSSGGGGSMGLILILFILGAGIRRYN